MPITDSAALRLSGFGTWMPGYIDDPNLNESEINRGLREGGRASFLVNATDNFSIRLTAFGQNLHTDGTPTVDVVGAAGTPLTPPANPLQSLVGDYARRASSTSRARSATGSSAPSSTGISAGER